MPESEISEVAQAACDEALRRIGECIRRRGAVLDLSGLKLTQLPGKISQLGKLTELNLAHNHLTELPPELAQLPQLTKLDLSHNPLANLPPELASLTNLAVLDLSHTQLSALPPEFGQLSQLTRLELSHTPLASLPPEIGQLANLTRLYLCHTPLTSLPAEIGELTSLTRVYLSNNRLNELPPELGRLANLTRLDLSQNRLESLPAALGQLAKLTVLDLSGNLLSELPAAIGDLARLTVLSLTANRLAALPESLQSLENIETIHLHDNPGLQLLPSVLGLDPRMVAAHVGTARTTSAKSILSFYFARLSGKTRPLNELKLHLVGRSGAGKTSLMHALRDLPWRDREDSTPGIALSQATLDGGPTGPITLHGWDFSGTALNHALHTQFFSRRSLYVVVLSGRDHTEQADADYWLSLILTHAADEQGHGPPVIVALNQWNVPGCRPEVDRSALRERYPFIRGFVEIDCKVKKGIAVLKTALARELERMPWVREPFPEEWHTVRRALAAETPCLTEQEFRTLCESHGVADPGQQDYLTEILHQLGTSLNFPQDTQSTNTGPTIWQPEWLTKSIYPLLQRAEKLAGVLTSAELALVLFTEPDEVLRAHLMNFLEQRGFAIPLQRKAGAAWLFPRSLPTEPTLDLSDFLAGKGAIRRRFSYSELPAGLLLQLAARRFDFIEEQKDHKQLWHSGLVLARKEARALILHQPQHRQMLLTVIGPHATRIELADLCRAEIHELHATTPELEVVEEIHIKGQWQTADSQSPPPA